jgi:hypothetical protein
MVEALSTIDAGKQTVKRLTVDIKNINLLKFKCISEFINSSLIQLFHRFNIKTDFLNEDPIL